MSRVLAAALILMLLAGCMAGKSEPARIHKDAYGRKIKDWQERLRHEGWTETAVRSIMAEFRGMVRYEMELKDHWATPGEFIANGLKGDCEDIAGFLMGSLKRLGYPHRTRILIVRDLFNHHALLKVELPSGRWAVFETAPEGPLEIHAGRFDPLIEFDEMVISYF